MDEFSAPKYGANPAAPKNKAESHICTQMPLQLGAPKKAKSRSSLTQLVTSYMKGQTSYDAR